MHNLVTEYLACNKDRPEFRKFGDVMQWTSVVATPRFKASSHLIFFVLGKRRAEPVMIAKVPRLPDDTQRLQSEFQNLTALNNMQTSEGVPRVLAFEEFQGSLMLVETAVSGQIMRPALVRKKRELCVRVGTEWLVDFQRSSLTSRAASGKVAVPGLEHINLLAGLSSSEQKAVKKTLGLAQHVRDSEVPAVFEHGDFSSPNLLLSAEGKLGVVDWELANRRGLPGVDLFFFLSYIAFAMAGATQENGKYMQAFQKAFFLPDSWATPYIRDYWQGLGLNAKTASSLFVLCWARYVSSLVSRLTEGERRETVLSDETQEWLRSNRYYRMWRFSLNNLDHLHLLG